MKSIHGILILGCVFLFSSCFTGIESTPKISNSEVEKQDAEEKVTDESVFARQMQPKPLSEWEEGREYVVTNNRISLIFSSTPTSKIPVKGDTILYSGYRKQTSIAATENTILMFTKKRNPSDTLYYRIEREYSDLSGRKYVDIPFTVDLSLIAEARKSLIDKELYILSSSWYSTEGQRILGRKYVKVKITDVVPGSEEHPISVKFNDGNRTAMAMFSTYEGENRRSFMSLFSFSDPHEKYPTISDENWLAIQNNQVRLEMTRDECRLSLGSPKDVDYGRSYSSTYERWTYTNGSYLIFEDGLLKRYRL